MLKIAKLQKYIQDKLFYRRELNHALKTQFLSRNEVLELQTIKLHRVLDAITNSVPYYKDIRSDINFKDFTVEELKKLPILKKKDIQENRHMFVNSHVKQNDYIWSHTSGSSGNIFEFLIPKYSDAFEEVFISRAWGMGLEYKYKPGNVVVHLRSYVPQEGQSLLKKKHNHWYLSAFDINKKNLSYYLNIIKKSNTQLLRGYPSSLYIFTLLLKENKIEIPQIKSLVTSSETLLPMYKKEIEDYWGIKVLDWYGLNERTVTVQRCGFGNYHNNDEYGLVEVLNDGTIIATSLFNDVMPFIRYNTGDIAINPIRDRDITCKCGRGLSIPFEGIEGRADDLLMKPDGTLVPTVNIYTLMYEYNDVKQFKITQQKDLSLYAQLVLKRKPTVQDEDYMRKSIRNRVGDLPIYIEFVEEIPRSRNTGKIKAVESLLNKP